MSKQTQTQNQPQAEPVQVKTAKPKVQGLETAVSTPYIPVLQRAYADPGSITPNDARVLQRAIRNQAIRHML